MAKCLYCQQESRPGADECENCGMPLPVHADQAPERRQRNFTWFVVGLTIFCVVMMVWLPRVIKT